MSLRSTCLLFSLILSGAAHAATLDDAAVGQALLSHARHSIAVFLGDAPAPPPRLPATRAGVFVTLEVAGRVRGCRGTLEPVTASLADEVARNAVAAATNDARFPPLSSRDLKAARISVTVVLGLDPVEGVASLRPEEGLVVRSGNRVGVVLPFEGRDPAVRLDWGRRKAGLAEGESCDLFRMRAVRFAEEVLR